MNHDGVFADFVAVPQHNLHLVPETVVTDAAVFTEPLAAAFQIPEQLFLARTDRVVVLDRGRVVEIRSRDELLARQSQYSLLMASPADR